MGVFDFFSKKEDVKPEISIPQIVEDSTTLSLQDVIAPAALEISGNTISLGAKVARTLFVISYPRYLTENWFSPIINLDKVFDISLFIHPTDTAFALKGFQKKVAEIESQISERYEEGKVRDPKLDTAYRDIEDLRDRLQTGQEKLFDVGLYITIYAHDETELDKLENEIKSILEGKLIYLKRAEFRQQEGLETSIPICRDMLTMHSKLNSEPLSSLFPFVSFDLSSDRGILYGVNRHNAGLVLFDRFSMPNYNSITFASSGAGKSYATKLEILRSLMFDTHVIVIDPEREYEQLAQSTGGSYFNISLVSDHHINPFELPHIAPDESPQEVLRSHIVSLVGLLRIMLGGLSPEEDSVIDQALSETYALKDIDGSRDFSEMEPPLLSDFDLVLSGITGAESVWSRLQKYTKGTWSGFLNKPSNVDINNKFVVFSVRDMEDELKPVAMHIVTHHIWNVVRRNIRKRLLVIDEAWWMMRSEDTASFLFGLAKRGRKYFLGLSTITQDVGDFLKSPYGLPIITNSSIQLLLKQSPTSVELVQQTFNLTDEEKYLLLESNVGEGIFFAGLKHVAIKIISSYTEDQIITSDPSQLLQIQQAKDQYRNSLENKEEQIPQTINDTLVT